jgi:hypothetical protein
MYGNLLLTIGGTIQQIIEHLQLDADERLIEPLWRMQVLVDRASRAHSDEEMDHYDDELLRALSGLRTLRDHLARDAQAVERGVDASVGMPVGMSVGMLTSPAAAPAGSDTGLDMDTTASGASAADISGAREQTRSAEETGDLAEIPSARYNGRRVTARLEATR